MRQYEAVKFYGLFTSINMFGGAIIGILGGFLGDFIGHKKMTIISGLLIAAGFVIMGFAREAVSLFLWGGLLLIIIGGGIFKVATNTLAGLLYPKNDARRDGGFTYLYVAVNIGAVAAPLLIGDSMWNGDSFHGVFKIAGGIMLAGIILFAALGRFIEIDNLEQRQNSASNFNGAVFSIVAVLIIIVVFFSGFLANVRSVYFYLLIREHTNRMIGTMALPATWFQMITPIFSILFAFILPWIYIMRARRGKNNVLGKFQWAFVFSAVGFIIMWLAGIIAGVGKVNMLLPVAACIAFALTEVFVAPLLFSVISNNAPIRRLGLFMGIALFVWSIVMLIAGAVAGWVLNGMPKFSLSAAGAAVVSAVACLIVISLTKLFGKLEKGV
jgi:dipeptide/tripeptide permease